MTNQLCDEFQDNVSKYLVRHRSILDVITKLQESVAQGNRAIVKSVTGCGCLQIDANKQPIPDDVPLDKIREYVQTHLEGELCPDCQEKVEEELGKMLFYLAAACTLLNMDLSSVLSNENNRITTLGIYSLT